MVPVGALTGETEGESDAMWCELVYRVRSVHNTRSYPPR